MEHFYFLAVNFLVFFIILFVDRRRVKNYIILGAFTLVLAFIFENFTTYLGFWYYHSQPKLLLVSLYTWLLYIPYISFCYFVGKLLDKRLGK